MAQRVAADNSLQTQAIHQGGAGLGNSATTHSMACHGNCGNCGSCSGCGRSLELTEPEIDFLKSLGQIPFQPVVRQLGEEYPLYPGGDDQTNLVLLLLEKKGLVSLDYDCPLSGYTEHGYLSYPIRGSVALTARGQQALDWMDYVGLLDISDKAD